MKKSLTLAFLATVLLILLISGCSHSIFKEQAEKEKTQPKQEITQQTQPSQSLPEDLASECKKHFLPPNCNSLQAPFNEFCEKCKALGISTQSQVSDIAIPPPKTEITFAKTVNFNADAFTKDDILKAKQLGANMITIWPARIIQNDEFIFFPEQVSIMINTAHKNGLQVELRSSFGGEQIKDYEKFKVNALKHAAEFAKFAGKYKVYRIVPFGEIDNNMINNCDKITELSKELLSEMRKHYSGQIGVGIAGPWRDCGYVFTGYDYMTISAYPQRQTGMNVWLTKTPEINLYNVISGARKIADRSGIKNLHIGETGVINPDDTKREDFQSFAEASKEDEAAFFSKLFEEVSDEVNGMSAFYNSRADYMSIYGDPAEEVIREWYGKL